MATSNRDRIGQMFDVMAPALDAFITEVVGPQLPDGHDWTQLVALKDQAKGISGKAYSANDPLVQLRMLTENVTGQLRKGWQPFDGHLSRVQQSYASELRDIRNGWAHGETYSDDDAYRALDTAERLLKGVAQPDAADAVARIRLNLRRVTADKDDRKVLRTAAADNPDAAGLQPWRQVLRPHDDVASGNFHASEFAADLYKVATGGEQDSDYADPVEFFRRTYLTEGLRDLIGRAVRRLAGDPNASPVINLQTNFGGGKTHSMLSLWHLAAGHPVGDFPQDVQELLEEQGYAGKTINRVALVGNHLSTSGHDRDGTWINTIWGELAWQLGGAEGYALVADADRNRTPPGQALHTLLSTYAPCVILVDEWVAYARSLVGRDDLAAGTFDDQFTFAQSLTEVVKGTPGALLAISIPASESGEDRELVAGNAEEVGGTSGLEALKRLQNVVRRIADQWRPASSDEAYHIVRQRLFIEPDAEALAAIKATAKGFVEFYRKYPAEFPSETREAGFEERIRNTYPIHPELFDRLYEEWSALERFQRTRGVLRLMSTVIHALWEGEDAGPLIMPGSIPLSVSKVNTEITQYLQDAWKPIIDRDVDGPNSEPAAIDRERPLFGQRSLTKRLARTVFFGAAPTIGSANKGIDTLRVFLGTAVPGDVPGNFHAALAALGDRATYFFSGNGRYWYDTQANITRTARDRAERLHEADVWVEIVRRLGGQARGRADFAAVHVCPEDTADIPDTEVAKLVILHPKQAHRRRAEDSPAMVFARQATDQHRTSQRTNRNMIVFLAPDEGRLAELDVATRDYLGWSSVLASEAELDLTLNQRSQATTRRDQAEATVQARLLQSFHWGLVPSQPDPGAPYVLREIKIEGSSDLLAERVSRKLGNDGLLYTRVAAASIRPVLDRVPQIWDRGHVSLGTLWSLCCQFPYMPRLRDRGVLDDGVLEMPLHWHMDAFALAQGFDEASGRYQGLWDPASDKPAPPLLDTVLLVRPDVAKEQLEVEARAAAGEAADDDVPQAHDPREGWEEKPGEPGVYVPKQKRFFGHKELNPDRYAVDFSKIADEVLVHLAQPGVELRVTLEVEAISSVGFDDSQVRTVSENASTLKFDQAGFEES